jgi:serine/threonine protein kinase
VGHYEITGPAVAGGMGEVYRARDLILDRDVALKVLPHGASGDADAMARFHAETRIAARMTHPNIVRIYGAGSFEGGCFAAMEFLEGETLRRRLTRKSVPWRSAAAIGAAVAEGLASIHAGAVVHLDVKPENIFLTFDGQVKIIDFGIARATLTAPGTLPTRGARRETASEGRNNGVGGTLGQGDTFETQAAGGELDTVLGTPAYMSPEQVRGEPALPASDIFSLGCVLYEMVTGRRPFTRQTDEDTRDAILHEDPPGIHEWRVAVPKPFDRIVARCLEKSPSRRFQSTSDLAFALNAVSTLSTFVLPLGVNRLWLLFRPKRLPDAGFQ